MVLWYLQYLHSIPTSLLYEKILICREKKRNSLFHFIIFYYSVFPDIFVVLNTDYILLFTRRIWKFKIKETESDNYKY